MVSLDFPNKRRQNKKHIKSKTNLYQNEVWLISWRKVGFFSIWQFDHRIILVLVIGGRESITHWKAIYSWHTTSGIYFQSGDYTISYMLPNPPFTGTSKIPIEGLQSYGPKKIDIPLVSQSVKPSTVENKISIPSIQKNLITRWALVRNGVLTPYKWPKING